jgi:ribonuclease HI
MSAEPQPSDDPKILRERYNRWHRAIVLSSDYIDLHVTPRNTNALIKRIEYLATYIQSTEEWAEMSPKKRKRDAEEPEEVKRQKPLRRAVVVYTDGACPKNGTSQARAGYGVYFGEADPRNISSRLRGKQTNNRAEMTAILVALTKVEPYEPLEIRTDSKLCINSITKWLPGWKKKGWKKSNGKPVLNADLWKEIDAALKSRSGKTFFTYVRGHSGDRGNDAADSLAVAGAAKG